MNIFSFFYILYIIKSVDIDMILFDTSITGFNLHTIITLYCLVTETWVRSGLPNAEYSASSNSKPRFCNHESDAVTKANSAFHPSWVGK